MNCPFCSAHMPGERILRETEHAYAIKDLHPVSRGHILIISKEHFEHWFEAPQHVQHDVMNLAQQMKEWLHENFQPHGYNLGLNCGVTAGQSVPHLHLHLIPRYHGDSKNPRGGVRGVIEEKKNY
ncbi:MAG TPA: HIT family protein [Rhabdochlamydiaceae bacterium]